MNDLDVVELNAVALRGISTEDLKRELAQSLQLSADALTRLAAIWRELETRGEDLSGLRAGIGNYISMIAAGRLAPEAVVRFAGNATMLRALSEQPIPVQRAITRDQPIDVVHLDGGGRPVVQQLPAYSLTASQVRQVFAPGKLRDTHEQQALVAQRAGRRRKAPRTSPRAVSVAFDAEADMLQVGRDRVPLAKVLGAIARMDANASEGEVSHPVGITINLTPEESADLERLAKEAGVSASDLGRSILRRAAAI